MSFTLDLQKFAKKTNANTELLVKSVVAGVAESIVEMSPVGDATAWASPPPKGYIGGRFRGNWDYGFNITPRTEFDVIDKTGAISLNRVDAGMIGKKMAGSIHFLANNMPYSKRLEDGWSNQAPSGMVRLTAIKWQSIVDEQARKLK